MNKNILDMPLRYIEEDPTVWYNEYTDEFYCLKDLYQEGLPDRDQFQKSGIFREAGEEA